MRRTSGFEAERNSRGMGYEVTVSLLELLNQEDALVRQLNNAKRALSVVSKSAGNTTSFGKEVRDLTVKVEAVRDDIREYMAQFLGIQVNAMKKEDKSTGGRAYVERERMISSLYNDSDE